MKSEHRRVAGRLGQGAEESIRAKEAIELLVIEEDPAQRLQPFILICWSELPRPVGEIGQDDPGLGELSGPVHHDRDLAHLVDTRAILGRALLGFAKEIDPDGLPVSPDQIEHQCGAISIAGLGKTIELVLRHRVSAG